MPEAVSGALVLGAERIPVSARPSYASINPSRPVDEVGRFPQAQPDDTKRAIDVAAESASRWAATSSIARGAILYRAAELLADRREEAAALIVLEVGKTRAESAGEVQRSIDILRYYAGHGSGASGKRYPSNSGARLIMTSWVPVGPVAIITPWNFPLAIPVWKLAPALVHGNTVVFKPAEEASAVGCLVAETLREAGLPDGVLNLLLGAGKPIADVMLTHSGLRGVTFTGSTRVGREVEQAGTRMGLKVQLELGGSNATIVLDDAPVDRAADLVVGAAMKLSGQKCTATSRLIATPGIYDDLRVAVRDRVAALRVGDPSSDPTVDVGPVISEGARAAAIDAVERAEVGGARVITGHSQDPRIGPEEGYFVMPSMIDAVAPDSFLGQEEVFGPILAMMPAGDTRDAVRLANGVRFGLSAAVITNDLAAALACADDLEVGVVKLNSESTGLEPHVPFGGLKDSGGHYPEQGTAARQFFTRTKTIYVDSLSETR